MIDWLLKRDGAAPQVTVAGRVLPLVLRRNAAARRMTMRLAPDGSEVRITLPQWGRTAEALEFAQKRQGWLAGQLAAVPQPATFNTDGLLPYRGDQLPICHDATAPRKVRLVGGELLVGGPAESLHARLRRWLKAEARRLLNEDLAFYCERAAQGPPRLMLSNAQRRWGSCARDRTIRINWRLVMAPDMVRRSVVAHEVAHLVHFDHSPAFHALLGALFEHDIRAANRWLKREGRGLYAALG